MKTFFKSTKGKIIAGASGAAVVGAIITIVIILNSGFRTILVQAFNGAVTVTNEANTLNAFEGQKLKDGDEVDVPSKGDLTLLVDSDKYIYAEENAHFLIEAKGTSDNAKTNIKQSAGTVLYRIDNKLKDSESYTVHTSNASLSVRGTVYRVSCDFIDGYSYTKVEVFEGSVYVEAIMENGDSTNQSRILNAGEMCIIHSTPDMSEFMLDEENNVVRLIEYDALPKETALKLGTIIDDGRELSITKELLYDVVEITEHEFIYSDKSIDPTCTLDGSLVEVCTICGMERTTIIEADIDEVHEYEYVEVEATCDSDGYTIKICKDCGEEVERIKTDTATPHHYGEWSVTKEATATEDGFKESICTDCGEKRIEVIKKTGNNIKKDNKNNNLSNQNSVSDNNTASQNTINDTAKKPDNTNKKASNNLNTNTSNDIDNNTSSNDSSSSSSDDDDDDDTSSNPCASGHSGTIIDRVAVTCQNDGYVKYKCSNCSEVWTVTTDPKVACAADFTRPGRTAISETCLTPRETIYPCKYNCGKNVQAVNPDHPALNPSGHTPAVDAYGYSMLYHDATSHYNQCSVCNEKLNEEGHDYTYNVVDNGDGTHSQECSCGEKNTSAPHSFSWVSYYGGKHQHVCSVCSADNGQATDHNFTSAIRSGVLLPDGSKTVDILGCNECGCSHSYRDTDGSIITADDGTFHCFSCGAEIKPY